MQLAMTYLLHLILREKQKAKLTPHTMSTHEPWLQSSKKQYNGSLSLGKTKD